MLLDHIHAVLVFLLLSTFVLFTISIILLIASGGMAAVKLLFRGAVASKEDALYARMLKIRRFSNALWWAGLILAVLLILNALFQEKMKQ